MELVIGNKNYSSWSMRPWLLLDAFSIPFTETLVSLKNDDGLLPERLSEFSASKRVPVLKDGAAVIWDSLSICEYISEVYLGGKGWPQNKFDRAVARSLCSELHAGFFNIRSELPLNARARRRIHISDQACKEIVRIEDIWAEYASHDVEGRHYLFSGFSIADCFWAPIALRFETYGVTLNDKPEKYKQSLLSHPSTQKWIIQAKREEQLPAYDIGDELE